MWVKIPNEENAIEELSKRIVSRAAPEELDIFDELMEEYFDDPHPPDHKPTASDDPLGFGLGEMIIAVTPAAAAMTNSVISFLLAILRKNDPNLENTSPISSGERLSSTTKLMLSQEELSRLHALAMQTALRYGMKETTAREMTNSLIISLLVSPAHGDVPVGSVKILFLASNPIDTQRLNLAQEIRDIKNALNQSDAYYKFELEEEWAVRVADLQALLLKHQPNIVNFSGHGGFNGEIILEDNQGISHPVSPLALSELFGLLRQNIRCVVLNACYSHSQAEAIAEHIDAVIGMPDAIEDTKAIAFTRSFYQALAYGQDIQTAFLLGVNQIELIAHDENKMPKLLTRSGILPDQIFIQSST